jgi:hypothetical protein
MEDVQLSTFQEDLVSNLILGVVLVVLIAARDLCKRISHSDCKWDGENGLVIKLPTFHREGSPEGETA